MIILNFIATIIIKCLLKVTIFLISNIFLRIYVWYLFTYILRIFFCSIWIILFYNRRGTYPITFNLFTKLLILFLKLWHLLLKIRLEFIKISINQCLNLQQNVLICLLWNIWVLFRLLLKLLLIHYLMLFIS